jgi:hypothetical protein
MKRNIKKHNKELKRKKKKHLQGKRISLKNRWWPAIYCLKEEIFIGVSDECMKVIRGKPKLKVGHKEWEGIVSRFRSEEYKIDMTKFSDGDIVYCPKCGGQVDFRTWISAKKPEFYD